jgi:hypothetical protein
MKLNDKYIEKTNEILEIIIKSESHKPYHQTSAAGSDTWISDIFNNTIKRYKNREFKQLKLSSS